MASRAARLRKYHSAHGYGIDFRASNLRKSDPSGLKGWVIESPMLSVTIEQIR